MAARLSSQCRGSSAGGNAAGGDCQPYSSNDFESFDSESEVSRSREVYSITAKSAEEFQVQLTCTVIENISGNNCRKKENNRKDLEAVQNRTTVTLAAYVHRRLIIGNLGAR